MALRMLMGFWGKWNIDAGRHSVEQLPPADYLSLSYYEKWLARVEILALETGLITEQELSSGHAETQAGVTAPTIEALEAVIFSGRPADRDSGRLEPKFSIGQTVRARNINPDGHTRLPRYVRGRIGKIHMIHGTHVFPDTNAHGKGESPQPLYNVKFAATELWGPAASSGDHLYIDLWEDYLETTEVFVDE